MNGAIVVPTDVNGTDKSITIDATGRTRIQKQVQFGPGTSPPVALTTIADMIANPQNYYVNIHTTVNGGGAMRGQLMPARTDGADGFDEPRPTRSRPYRSTAPAWRACVAARARDASGAVAAPRRFSIWTIPASTRPPELPSPASTSTANGREQRSVIINTGIGAGAASVPIDPLRLRQSELRRHHVASRRVVGHAPINGELNTVNSLFVTPANQYINTHTDKFGGGVMRDQMRPTEQVKFDVNMLASNENPPIAGLTATAPTGIPIYILRNADGTVAAGAVIFDVNYRGFAAGTTIHRAAHS